MPGSGKNERPVIVFRRAPRRRSLPQSGAWKIAYADFITAMMAFFLVMWLLSIVPRNELDGIANYFRTPLVSAIKGERPQDPSLSVIPGGDPSPINERSNPTEDDIWAEQDLIDLQQLEDLRARLEQLIEQNPVLKRFRPQLVIDMTPEGLQIQITDTQNRPMFATGSAQMHPYMREILAALAPTLTEMPNGISISGHTDAQQYTTGERLYSNWELSADRANNARQALVGSGLESQKIRRIQGLASIANVDDDPYADANRRISIVVMTSRAERQLRQSAASIDIRGETLLSPDDPSLIRIEVPAWRNSQNTQNEQLSEPETEVVTVYESLYPPIDAIDHKTNQLNHDDLNEQTH